MIHPKRLSFVRRLANTLNEPSENPTLQGHNSNARGILYIILSVIAFSLMDTTAKAIGTQADISQLLIARYGGQLVILILVFGPRLPKALKTSYPKLQFVRSAAQLTAAACFFTALKTNGLSEATAVADLAPVFITIAAAVVLKERVGPRRMIGVGLALIGALIVIRPGSDIFSATSLWPLGTAVSLALYAIVTRHIGSSEAPLTALLYSGLVCTGIMICIAPFRWVSLEPTVILGLCGMAIFGICAQFLMVKAYMTADASVVAPFSYAGLITATFCGFVFFGDVPDLWTCIGALVIVGAGLYVWNRERQLAQTAERLP